MLKRFCSILALVVLPLFALSFQGNGFLYIAPNGNDDNPCTLAAPCLTLPVAAKKATDGQTIYLQGGAYFPKGQWTLDRLAPNLTITTYPGDPPATLNGSQSGISGTASLVLISNSHDLTVSLLEIVNSPARGISVYESDHITLFRLYVHEVYQRCAGGGGSNILISQSFFEHCGLVNSARTLTSGWPSAVSSYLRANGSLSDHWAFENNLIQKNYGEGLTCYYVVYCTANGNVILDNFSVGLYADIAQHVSIDQNLFAASDPAFTRDGKFMRGISIGTESGPTASGWYTITHNTLSGVDIGVRYFCYLSDCSYGGQNIHDNVIRARTNSIAYTNAATVFGENLLFANSLSGTISLPQASAWIVQNNVYPFIVTPTGSPTPTWTPSRTPTRLASPSSSPSALPSASPSPTPSPRPSATPTVSGTPSMTWTPPASVSPTLTPTPGPTKTFFQVGVLGDFGWAGTNESNVSKLIHSWNPALILTTGDDNYDNGAASSIDQNIGQYFHDYIAPYTGIFGTGAATNKFWPVIGNHDCYTNRCQPYLDYFHLPGNERYYTFTYRSVQFFMLNSDPSEPDGISNTSAQHAWFINELSKSTALWKVVVFHHTAWTSGTNHGSNTTMQSWGFENLGVQLVLSGHEHLYERVVKGSTVFITDGLGGKSRYACGSPVPGSQKCYADDYGALQLTIADDRIDAAFVTQANKLIDSWSITRSVTASTPTLNPTPTTEALGRLHYGLMFDLLNPASSQVISELPGLKSFRPSQAGSLEDGGCAECDRAHKLGLEVFYTVRSEGASLADYQAGIGPLLDRVKPEWLVIENEPDNLNFYAGSPEDYRDRLQAGCNAAHGRGLRCTGGGITYKTIACVAKEAGYLPSVGFACNTTRMARAKALLAYEALSVDALNFHFYGTAPDELFGIVDYLSDTYHLPVLSNETGNRDGVATSVAAIAGAARTAPLVALIWYSPYNGGPTGTAYPLQTSSGQLTLLGQSYRDTLGGP